jgi:MarR family transcriptional regulator, transcriptional regulator for hemolysin
MDDTMSRDRAVGFLVHEVARLFRRRFEDEARVHGVTMPQWRIIAELKRQDALSGVALAAVTDTDPMTVSGILDRLEKRELIERFPDPKDSRAKLARLTPQGVELYMTAKSVGLALQNDALIGLSPKERDDLIAVLTKVRTNLISLTSDEREAS